MATVSILADGLDHPEGLAWSPNGWLACGGEAGQLYDVQIDTHEVRQLGTTGGFVLGLAFDASDRLYACDLDRRAVLRFDPATDELLDLTTDRTEMTLRLPNYPVFSTDGHLFFSDSGDAKRHNGCILVRRPDGAVRIASNQVPGYTNGLAIDLSNEFLYVVESDPPGISRLRLLAGGRLGSPEQVVEMPRTVPDGLAFCADGRLLVACYRPDQICIWDGKDLTVLVSDWTGDDLSAPTNLCFFGDGLERLAVANLAGHHLAEIELGLVGAPLNYPMIAID